MEKLRELLIEGSRELGIELSEKQVKQFLTYLGILRNWNERINLTSLKDSEEIIVTHFLDSLSVSKGIEENRLIRVIDIGTGAGFPGIPVKILKPEIFLSLLDSSRKRIEFLKYLSKSLKLKDLEIIWGRAEDYGRKKGYRGSYNIVLARALAKLNVLVELGIPLLKIKGLFIAQKSQNLKEELEDARRAIEILGGELKEIISVKSPFSRKLRKLVIIEKILETPLKFPRRSGIPQKRPLK